MFINKPCFSFSSQCLRLLDRHLTRPKALSASIMTGHQCDNFQTPFLSHPMRPVACCVLSLPASINSKVICPLGIFAQKCQKMKSFLLMSKGQQTSGAGCRASRETFLSLVFRLLRIFFSSCPSHLHNHDLHRDRLQGHSNLLQMFHIR